MSEGLVACEQGKARCWWHGGDADYMRYHDEEWGRPVSDDIRLFEKLCLEGFQAGLSWLTILRKRENFRRAFAGFDFNRVAEFTEKDVERLLQDAGIIRHRGKIEATINNAQKIQPVIEEFGSFAAYIWRFEPGCFFVFPAKAGICSTEGKDPRCHGESRKERPAPKSKADIPAIIPESLALSKDLKKRGFKFVGPTTMYALMQAMGMVNDHLTGCCVYEEVEKARMHFKRPVSFTQRP